MSFFKSSLSHQYLYSPVSWLHKTNVNCKLLVTIGQLILLLYLPTIYTSFYLLLFLLLSRFIYYPKNVKRYLRQLIYISMLYLLINIKYTKSFIFISDNWDKFITLQPFLHYNKFCCNKNLLNTLSSTYIYLPVSILRLLNIMLIYFLVIKTFLLTTYYETIIYLLFSYINYLKIISESSFKFEMILSSQFTKMIFIEIDTLNTAYLIRGMPIFKLSLFRQYILIVSLLCRQLSLSLYHKIHYIASTLYSREISSKNSYNFNIDNSF